MNIQSFTNLNNRSVIGVSGEETFDFLQSIVTGDISLLLEEISCILSFKSSGRVLSILFYIKILMIKGLSVFVDCEKLETEDLIKKLKIYRLRSKIDIINLTDWNVCLCPNETVNSTVIKTYEIAKRVMAKVGLGKNDQGLELEYNRLRHELCLPEGSKEIPRGEALPLITGWQNRPYIF